MTFFQIKIFFINATIKIFLSFQKLAFPKGSRGKTFSSSTPRVEKNSLP